MNTIKPVLTAVLLLAMHGVPSVFAATIDVSADEGTIQYVNSVSEYHTTGAMMDGMQVTAYFYAPGDSTESFQVLNWTDWDNVSGGVSGTGWSLSQSGDTFDSAWTLSTSGATLSRLVIDGAPGDTVFDLSRPRIGTRGSAEGTTFELVGDSVWDLSVTYSDAIALRQDQPVRDLYRSLTIDFADSSPLGTGQTFRFLADADNLSYGTSLASVPIPGAAWLFGSGLLGLAGVWRRRSRVGLAEG